MRGDEQEPDTRCGTPGTSGHVTAKSSIRSGVGCITPASTRETVCVLPWEICRLSRRVTEGGGSRPDRSAEVSRGQSRFAAGEASEAPQGRKAGQQIGRAAPQRTEGPNGTPRGEGRRGAVTSCRAAVQHPSGSSCCPWAARSMGMKSRLGHGEKTLRWKGVLPLNPPNRRVRDPYARWCDRESGRPPTYVD